MPPRKSPQAFDVEIGRRVRLRRTLVGKSLPDIAAEVGITWQQVQKYEKGADRISCSMLVVMAKALMVNPSYFFETIEEVSGPLQPKLDAMGERIACEAAELTDRQHRLVLNIIEEFREQSSAFGEKPKVRRAAPR